MKPEKLSVVGRWLLLRGEIYNKKHSVKSEKCLLYGKVTIQGSSTICFHEKKKKKKKTRKIPHSVPEKLEASYLELCMKGI